MVDTLVNWILDLVEAAIALWPTYSLPLPSTAWISGPLSEINWLIAVDMPFQVGIAMLLLSPAMLFTKLTLWVIGLFTPSSTAPA